MATFLIIEFIIKVFFKYKITTFSRRKTQTRKTNFFSWEQGSVIWVREWKFWPKITNRTQNRLVRELILFTFRTNRRDSRLVFTAPYPVIGGYRYHTYAYCAICQNQVGPSTVSIGSGQPKRLHLRTWGWYTENNKQLCMVHYIQTYFWLG